MAAAVAPGSSAPANPIRWHMFKVAHARWLLTMDEQNAGS
jgi:hypothetical protein